VLISQPGTNQVTIVKEETYHPDRLKNSFSNIFYQFAILWRKNSKKSEWEETLSQNMNKAVGSWMLMLSRAIFRYKLPFLQIVK